MKIEVHPYNVDWPEQFQEIKNWLMQSLHSPFLSIEHVGSTSVPGLSAKPIIDIDIIIEKESAKEAIISELDNIGYQHLGDLGIIGREAFRKKGKALDFPNHNLYVIPENNVAWHNHRYLRDYLRANEDMAKAYGELKTSLSENYPDNMDAYLDGKTNFILDILKSSEIPEEALNNIEEQNKILNKNRNAL